MSRKLIRIVLCLFTLISYAQEDAIERIGWGGHDGDQGGFIGEDD